MIKLKDLFGIGSLGKYTNPTDGYQARYDLGIWVVHKEKQFAGRYVGHINSGQVLMRNDRTNLLENAGYTLIDKKEFLEKYIVERITPASDLLNINSVFI